MKVIGSVIARLGSKRLPYKNLLPFEGIPLVRMGVLKLLQAESVDQVVLSTESELIARQVADLEVVLLKRPETLAGDGVPSVPVFQHIVSTLPCEIHVNYNINFPLCSPEVIDRAVQLVSQSTRGEVLSRPYAVWAQTSKCLSEYGDPWDIRADLFEDSRIQEPDVHLEEDLLQAHRLKASQWRAWFSE